MRNLLLPVLLALALGGCSMNREPLRYYTLDAPPVERPQASLPELTLGVGPMRMPTILDRPGIVIRLDTHRVEVLAFDQWAGNLKGEIQNLFADQLARQLGTQRIALYPWSGDSVDLQVMVELLELVGEPGGKATLTASWTLIDVRNHKVLKLEKSTRETDVAGEPPAELPPKEGAGIPELVAAYSRLAAGLAEEIAGEIAARNNEKPR